MSSSIASRSNIEVIESLYADWIRNPDSVSRDWASFFEGFEIGMTLTPEAHRDARGSSSQAGSGATYSGETVGGIDMATRARIV